MNQKQLNALKRKADQALAEGNREEGVRLVVERLSELLAQLRADCGQEAVAEVLRRVELGLKVNSRPKKRRKTKND